MYKFFSSVKEYGNKIQTLCANMSDPCVGHHLLDLQERTFISRLDGRSPEHFFQQGGLIQRVPLTELKEIRFSRVEKYQKYNEDPFAWGACSSMHDLARFVTENKAHAENAWIHKFYGKATSLFQLKYKTGIESESLDDEKEHLVLETIPFSQFLVSIDPKFQKKFLDGGLIPNKMVELNPDLPKTVRITDLQSDAAVLLWLMKADANDAFADLCKSMYGGRTEQRLQFCFKDNQDVYDAVTTMLSQEQDQVSLRKL